MFVWMVSPSIYEYGPVDFLNENCIVIHVKMWRTKKPSIIYSLWHLVGLHWDAFVYKSVTITILSVCIWIYPLERKNESFTLAFLFVRHAFWVVKTRLVSAGTTSNIRSHIVCKLVTKWPRSYKTNQIRRPLHGVFLFPMNNFIKMQPIHFHIGITLFSCSYVHLFRIQYA